MTDRRFRFGIVAGYTPDLDSLTGLARRAEELGYDTLVTPDPATGRDPLVALSTVAAVTRELRFGTFVLAESLRDRALLTWQASSLNELSGGRLELGLGLGRPGTEQRAAELGREFGTPAQRLARLTETVAGFNQLEQRPRLLLAGSGRKLLDLAAREADIVTLPWRPRTTESEAVSIVDRFKDIAESRFDSIELNINLMAVGDDLPTEPQKYIGASLAELAEAGAVTVLRGSTGENAETLRRWRDRMGISYITVSSQYMDRFAPVIEELRGS